MIYFIYLVKQSENWMRHGYPAAMGHGAPITILKRGPSGTSQTDTQVKMRYIYKNVTYTYK